MEFEEYPKWIVDESHPDGGVIVSSKEEEDALTKPASKSKAKADS